MTTDKLLEKYGTERGGHAIFAPSASASWLTCSGSLLVNARAGDTAGEDAARGTVAHFVAECWNKASRRPDHMVGSKMIERAGGVDYIIPITEDMLYHVGRYVEWCRELPGDHYFEQRVDISELTPIPEQRGTADHFACEPGVLTITDLKYGTGVRVYAEKNPQAMLYACGAFLEWDWIYRFERIVIRICQPRLDVFEVWECTRQELLDFMEYVKVRARMAWDENASRTPSKKACRFCSGEATCPARLNELNDFVDEAFETDDEDLTEEPKTYPAEALEKPLETLAKTAGVIDRLANTVIPELTTRQLAFLLHRRKHVQDFFKAVADLLLDRAEKGEEVPWFKLGEGRKKRGWKDKGEAVAFICREWGIDEVEVKPPTIRTPNQMEKLIRAKTKARPKDIKDKLEHIVAEFAGKRSLIPLEDGRPDVEELTDDFDTEDGDEDDDL